MDSIKGGFMGSIRRHLGFANVASAIALFVAIGGGTAFALAGHNSVFSDDIKNGQVKGVDVKESSLGIVPSANPEAFARVSPTGDVSQAKGVSDADVTLHQESTYCFDGLGFQPRGGQVNIDYIGNQTNVEFTELGVGDAGGCPSGTQAFVWIHDTTGSSVPAPFFVVFYR